MGSTPTLLVRFRGAVATVFLDLIVIANAVVVGLELDDGGNGKHWRWLRYIFCGAYILETGLRLYVQGLASVRETGRKAELLVVVLACFGVFALGGKPDWFWRITVLRLLRLGRVWRLAANWRPLKDLWLVLLGIARAVKAMLWLAVVILLVLYAFAGSAKGLVAPGAEGEDDDECPEDAEGGSCLDKFEYFGSVARSMLTLLQLVTLDGWAAKVVRPLATSRPWAAFCLSVFSITTAYGLKSAAVGVLVWSTVELARSSESHGTKVQIMEDMSTITMLTTYFEASLLLEERNTIAARQLRDSMFVPAVAKAFRQLELPVSDIDELFNHLDTRRCGEITMDEFEKGLQRIKKPTTRFDVACLTARIGGSLTFARRIEDRTEGLLGHLAGLRQVLEGSFEAMGGLAAPGSSSGQVLEVGLRKAGRIYVPAPLPPFRYSA